MSKITDWSNFQSIEIDSIIYKVANAELSSFELSSICNDFAILKSNDDQSLRVQLREDFEKASVLNLTNNSFEEYWFSSYSSLWFGEAIINQLVAKIKLSPKCGTIMKLMST